jgi:anti-anti-sigma regulatory factor
LRTPAPANQAFRPRNACPAKHSSSGANMSRRSTRRQWRGFMTILDNLPNILYVVDLESYGILFANGALRETVGGDPTGKECFAALHGLSAPCDFCTNDIILRDRKPYTWERYNERLGRHFQITDQVLRWPDGRDVRFEVAVDVTERKRSAEELRRLVEERTRRIDEQSREILDLSTPVMEVWEGVVLAPLIGTLDSDRSQQFTDRLLNAVVKHGAAVALVDITGVPQVDTETARNLIETVAAVRLLGAEVVLTGIRASIAQTLVHQDIDLSAVVTRSSLAAGLKVAMEKTA